MKHPYSPIRILSACFLLMTMSQLSHAQTMWIGTNDLTASTNWSDTLNWSAGVPGPGINVVFTNTTTAGTPTNGVIDNVVDANFTIGGLAYNQTNGYFHTTMIPSGRTLTAAGPTIIGGQVVSGMITSVAMTDGGTLVLNTNLTVGNNGSAAAAQGTMFDLSALSNFVFDASGSTMALGSGNRSAADMRLAAGSNYITAATLNANATSTSSGTSGTLTLGGGTNIINVTTLNAAVARNNSTITFGTNVSGGLRLRGLGGTDADRANMTLGNRNQNTSGGNNTGTLNFINHPVDIKFGTVTIGQATSATPTGAQAGIGIINFNLGRIDAITINMAISSANAFNSANGTINVGTAATLVVSNMSLANQGALGTSTGLLNITNGGIVICSNSITKASAAGTATINVVNSTLNLVNPAGVIGSPAFPITVLTVTNSTLTLAADSVNPTCSVSNFNTGGATSTLNISDIPVISGYPAQFKVIKYVSLNGTPDFNFGTRPTTVPPLVGYISNNVAAGSVDLVLTSGPQPAKTLTWNATVNNDWGYGAAANWKTNTGAPLANFGFTSNDFVRLDDDALGANATNVILTTTVHPSSLTVSNVTKTYVLNGSFNVSGPDAFLVKQGSGTLILDNAGTLNDYGSGTFINAGTVQIGMNDTGGSLPDNGAVLNNGSLVINRADNMTVSNVISGGGSITKLNPTIVSLTGASPGFTGTVSIAQGTLKIGNVALGVTNNGVTVSSGATLDVNGFSITNVPVIASGLGYLNGGAIVNSRADNTRSLKYVTLAGNTVFGGSFRWDIRNTGSTAILTNNNNPYTITKIGPNQVSLVGVAVDPALGNIDVQEGMFGAETSTSSLGDPAATLAISTGATFEMFDNTVVLSKNLTLADSATMLLASGNVTFGGPVTIGNSTINVTKAAPPTLTLTNTIGGPGGLTKTGNGTLVLNSPTINYAGGTTNNAGKLIVNSVISGGGYLLLSGGAFGGNGTNSGTLESFGTLMPGDTAVGTLGIGGNLICQGDSKFTNDLNTATTIGGGINDLIEVAGDVTANAGKFYINALGPLGGSYTLIRYGGLFSGAFESVEMATPSRYTPTLDTSVGGVIKVNITGSPVNLRWNGGIADPTWDANPGLQNWINLATASPDAFYNADSVLFDDTATVTNVISLSSTLSPSGITNDSSAGINNFTLTGAGKISGSTALLKKGTSTLTISTTNDFTGGVNISGGGTVRFMANSAAGSGPMVVRGSTAVQGGTFTNSISISNSVLGVVTADFTMPGDLTSVGTNVIYSADPQNPSTTRNYQIDGALHGSGAILLLNATNVPSPDGGQGVRFRSTNSDYTGTIYVTNNVKSELRVQGPGPFSPIGSGKVVMYAGDFSGSNAQNAPFPGGYSEMNIRNLYTNHTVLNTDFEIVGAGTIIFNMLDGQSNTTSTLGNLKIGNDQEVGVYGGGSATVNRPLVFTTITLTGGNSTLSPRLPGFGAVANIGADLRAGNISQTAPASLTMGGLQTLTLTGTNTYTGDTIINSGTLALTGNSALTNSPTVVLATNAVIDVSARAIPTFTVVSGRTLKGSGTIRGSLTANSGSTLLVGTNTGLINTLVVTNVATLGGTLSMEIDAAAGTNDRVAGASSIVYGGTLTVANLSGSPTNGQTFKLFSAGSYSGTFQTNLPALDPGLFWNTNNLTVDGTLSVVAAASAPTNSAKILSARLIAGSIVLHGTNNNVPNTSFHYAVLTSTNLALPLGSWTSIATNSFNGDGTFDYTNAVNTSVRQLFYEVKAVP